MERVEGLATKVEWRRAFDEINEFERMLDDDSIRLVKLFFSTLRPKSSWRGFVNV